MPAAKTVSRAIIQTLASRQFSLLIRAVGLMVLARLLTPEDFGLFAIAMTIMTVSLTIVDFGLPSFLITAQELTRDKVRSAVGMCLSLALAVVGTYAVALAWLPQGMWPDGMRTALALLALGLLFRPLVLSVESSLRRDLEFGLLSILSVVQIAVQTAVACGLAIAGAGVAALAGGVLALSGLFLPFVKMSMKFFVALGMSREYLRLQVRQQIVKVLLVAGGAFISLEAACLGLALGIGFKALQVTWALKPATGYRSRDLARIMVQCAAITVCTVAGPALLVGSATGLSDAAILAAALPSAGLGWVLGAAVTQHPLLTDVLRLVGVHGRRMAATTTDADTRGEADR